MDYFVAGKWEITTVQGRMMGSEDLDRLGLTLNLKIPGIVYTGSSVQFRHLELPIVFSISLNKALELISDSKRAELLYNGNELTTESISFIPNHLQVASAKHWQGRTLPKEGNFVDENTEKVTAKVMETRGDWTFTTLYKGSFSQSPGVRAEVTDEQIPIERLGVNNQILWGSEVLFYEDELDDCGQCKFNLRVRAMGDCFFALLRMYVRVDHVAVRICDTRIFHGYESRCILREFIVKESTYDELRENGVLLSPQWSIEPRQSDIIFEQLRLLHTFKDKISY